MNNNDKPSTVQLTYEETTFFGLLKISGIKEFINWSMFHSLLLTLLLNLFFICTDYKYSSLFAISKQLSPVLLGAATGVFGIVIASLTITISLFHEVLLPAMLQTKLLHKYLFPFWKAVVLWAINIVINTLLTIMTIIKFKKFHLVEITMILEIALFLYATFFTVKLTGLVIQLALQKAQIINKK